MDIRRRLVLRVLDEAVAIRLFCQSEKGARVFVSKQGFCVPFFVRDIPKHVKLSFVVKDEGCLQSE